VTQFPEDQVAELRRLCPGLKRAAEADCPFYLLPGLSLRDGCSPSSVDALLCPVPRDGYPFRLFFAERIATTKQPPLNWNAAGVRILERNWFAFSWKIDGNLRLLQMVTALLSVMT
jgi:hypothetical protein